MNIFFLDEDEEKCAQAYCDKHIVKMPIELAQMLSTAHHVLNSGYKDKVYKPAYVNHPMSVWVRATELNYSRAYVLWHYLCSEYEKRYNRVHKVEELWPFLYLAPNGMAKQKETLPPLCMPNQFKPANWDEVVRAYRQYYRTEKRAIATWKYTKKPNWF